MNFPMIVATHHMARNCRDNATGAISSEINTAKSAWNGNKNAAAEAAAGEIDVGRDGPRI
jgi:hypothetical protein